MKMKVSLSLATCSLAVLACGKKGDGGFNEIPALAPLVQQSLPSSLKASGSARFSTDDFSILALASSNIETLFKTGSYGKLSGGNGKGYINSMLEDLDSRFDELSERFEEAPDCFSNTAQTHEFDFSAIGDASVASTLKISLDLQCRDLFGGSGDQSGAGSGMLFGKSENNYSLALLLNAKNETNSGFGYYAKVSNKGADDEEVNMIFAESRPSGSTTAPSGLSSLARIKAKPKAKIYEMAMAASDPSRGNPISGGTVGLSCGFHAVTDGTNVYVKAIDRTAGGTCSGGAGGNYVTELCLKASDLSANSSVSDCASVKASMTIGSSDDLDAWDYNDTTTAKATDLYNVMKINTATIEGKTSDVD